MLKKYGYVRVGSAVNKISLGNVDYNVNEIIECIKSAEENGVEILCFPQLSLCGYTSLDMLYSDDLYNSCLRGLKLLKDFSATSKVTFIVGSPIKIKNALYNCAVSISKGKIIGITPKSNFINFSAVNESRYFSSGEDLNINNIELFGEEVLISDRLLYSCNNYSVNYAIEFNEDIYKPYSVTEYTSKEANLIFCLSSLPETVGKYKEVKGMVKTLSTKYNCAYIYSSCGVNESTSDLCYAGAAFIVEPTGDLVENKRYNLESSFIYQDVDFMRINNLKLRNQTKYDCDLLTTSFELYDNKNFLTKKYSKTPFLDYSDDELEEILTIQTVGLARRVKLLGNAKMVIGISGGSDSTLAFIVCLRVLKMLNLDNSHIIAITMPGFGTSGRTYENAKNLVIENGIELREISIKNCVSQHYVDINHSGAFDVTYENAQARERTQILFDVANMVGGIVIGTGDLSEEALGWCTYNGDHMSNYSVNGSIPKGLVTKLIAYTRDSSTGVLKKTLTDILNTPISPELLPLDEKGNIKQDTQKSIGPYVLHDFFLYHLLKYGASVKKLYFLGYTTFADQYSPEEIKAVLTVFIKRFFTQQFKRNCMPDGIKATEIGLSPRGDFLLGSDFSAAVYLKGLSEL